MDDAPISNTMTPKGTMMAGLLFAVLTIALDVYLLQFLDKVKQHCYNAPTTPRVIAQIILWLQLLGSVLACIVGIYVLFACRAENATSNFCTKMLSSAK